MSGQFCPSYCNSLKGSIFVGIISLIIRAVILIIFIINDTLYEQNSISDLTRFLAIASIVILIFGDILLIVGVWARIKALLFIWILITFIHLINFTYDIFSGYVPFAIVPCIAMLLQFWAMCVVFDAFNIIQNQNDQFKNGVGYKLVNPI